MIMRRRSWSRIGIGIPTCRSYFRQHIAASITGGGGDRRCRRSRHDCLRVRYYTFCIKIDVNVLSLADRSIRIRVSIHWKTTRDYPLSCSRTPSLSETIAKREKEIGKVEIGGGGVVFLLLEYSSESRGCALSI